MRQAIHIFQKDVRHLWIEIAVVLAATGLFIFTHTHQGFWQSGTQMPQTVAAFLVSFLLPVSWWVLIVRAVHGETLTGDSEFWTTRPYSWNSLLAAKTLVIALFVNAPILAAQAVILETHGFSLWAELPGLLWNQVLLTVAFFLPVAAIGALTSGMVQFLILGLVAFAGTLLLSLRFAPLAAYFAGGVWMGLEWIRTYYSLLVLALAMPAILIWQYARRRTVAARLAAAVVAVVLALGMPLSWNSAFAIQSRLSRHPVAAASIRAGLNTGFQWMTRALVEHGRGVTLSVPVQLTGLPEDRIPKPVGVSVTIAGSGGAVWRDDSNPIGNVSAEGALITLRAKVDEAFYEKVKDGPVALRGDLYLALYSKPRETKVPFAGSVQPVPGLGLCAATGEAPAPYFLNCYWALRPRADLVAIQFEPTGRPDHTPPRERSYSPFPAELSIDPLTPTVAYSIFKGPLEAATVSTEEPTAFVRAPLAIDGLRLGAYEVKLK